MGGLVLPDAFINLTHCPDFTLSGVLVPKDYHGSALLPEFTLFRYIGIQYVIFKIYF